MTVECFVQTPPLPDDPHAQQSLFFLSPAQVCHLLQSLLKEKSFYLENDGKRDGNSFRVEKFEQTPSLRTCVIS